MPMKSTFAAMRPEIHHSNYFELSSQSSWGPRQIPDYELILAVSGEFLYVEEGGRPLAVHAGDVLCIPPGVTHTLSLAKRLGGSASISCLHLEFEEGLCRLSGDYVPEIEPPRITRVGRDTRMHLLFKGIAETHAGYGSRRRQMETCMVRELFLRLAEFWEGRASAPSARAREMAECISESLSLRVGRRELSRRFGLSPERIDCLFKTEFGLTPTQFLHAGRVAKACSMLIDEGLSVKEAASALGFSDESHFSKIFKKYMGMPPSRIMPVKKGT